MRHNTLILCCLTAPLFTGCFTTGKDFPSDLNWIKKEQTSKNDVKMMLGMPYSVGNSSGTPTWTYAFYEYKLFGKANHKELKFYWGPEDMVKYFNFNSSFPSDTTGMKAAPVVPAQNEGMQSAPSSNAKQTTGSKWGSY